MYQTTIWWKKTGKSDISGMKDGNVCGRGQAEINGFTVKAVRILPGISMPAPSPGVPLC
jgi:hypothetical protein